MDKITQMMRRRGVFLIVILAVVVCIAYMTMTSHAISTKIEIDQDKLPTTEEGKQILNTARTWNIAPGITETELITNTKDNNNQNIDHVLEVKMGKDARTKILAGYKDYDGNTWGLQTTTNQARAAESKTGQNVVAAINADIFDMSNGAPHGALVMDGKVYNGTNDRDYFCITKDGKAEIRTGDQSLDDCETAVGGWSCVVKDGTLDPSLSSGSYFDPKLSRQAVGIKEDGTVLTYTTHGINYPISSGRAVKEVAEMLMALGCKDVFNLDGGGSATLSTEREGKPGLAMRNESSDGSERQVSSTLLFVSTAAPDGEFDHFALEPNDNVYTQHSTIQFTSTAVDSSGKKIDEGKVPTDAEWSLSKESEELGEIDGQGKFTSNGKEGEVTTRIISKSKGKESEGYVVGSTVITIAGPDEITFKSKEVTLGFDKTNDLGIVAKWKGRTVIFKKGDFSWDFVLDKELNEEGPGPAAVATIGNVIVTAKKGGTKGNDLSVEIVKNEDEGAPEGAYKVKVYEKSVLKETFGDKDNKYITSADILSAESGGFANYLSAYVKFSGKGSISATEGQIALTGGAAPSVDSIGTFDNDGRFVTKKLSADGTITATYTGDSKDTKGSLHVIVGKMPKVLMDFEPHDGKTPSEYWDFSKAIIDPSGGIKSATTLDGTPIPDINQMPTKMVTGSYDRGGKESAEIIERGIEPVRFGNHALKLNYDFSGVNNATEGAGVGFSNQTAEVEGMPTAIGMWVYAPEGTPNLWLRIRIQGAGGTLNLNFTEQMQDAQGRDPKDYGGINWTGWKYVEASLDGTTGPYKLMGGESIRVMRLFAQGNDSGGWTKDGDVVAPNDCKGSIYIDNLRFVYGANVDDTDSPIIPSITANQEELNDGDTIKTNKVHFFAMFNDLKNDYTTGMDYSATHLYIDGEDMSKEDHYRQDTQNNTAQLDGVELPNGTHTIKMLVADKFGNETTETRTFTVDGPDDTYTRVSLAQEEVQTPTLDQSSVLLLKSNNVGDVKKVSSTIKLSKDTIETVEVKFHDDYTGKSSYDSIKGILTLEAERKSEAASTGADTIATITTKIPKVLAAGSKLSYGVTKGNLTYASDKGPLVIKTFSSKTKAVDIEATYTIAIDDLIVGTGDKKLYVYDKEGKPVAKAKIYNKGDDSVFGTTNYKGWLDITDLCEESKTYSFYAEKDGRYSFLTEGQSFAPAGDEKGLPICVMNNASGDAQNTKSVTWLSSPTATEKQTIMQVARKADYETQNEAAFKSYAGKHSLQKFTGATAINKNYTVKINQASATDLTYNVDYVYRVGDGKNWSEIQTFKLKKKGTNTNLFVLGDVQAQDTSNAKAVVKKLADSELDFAAGIQVGDLIENAALYDDWQNGLDVFAGIKGTDIVQIIGNHEDAAYDVAQKVFNLPTRSHYSVEYGNVYIATISYTLDQGEWQESIDWLKADAKKSDATWKILVTHQPPYYTHAQETGNKIVNKLLPPAVEAAGIDMVFSGHDHAYARTKPLTGGKVDEAKGITYFVCGNAGEKVYPSINNPDFHFDKVLAGNDIDYTATYMTLSATDEKITVKTYDLNRGQLDEFTKDKVNLCVKDGHKYVYDGSEYLNCSVDGHAVPITGYTGFAKDKNTKMDMYFVDGTKQTGYFPIGDDKMYYFDANGLGEKAKLITDVKATCTVYGRKEYASSLTSQTFKLRGDYAPGHEYVEKAGGKKVCKVCGWQQVDMKDCKVYIGYTYLTYSGKERRPTVSITYTDPKTKKVTKFTSFYEYKTSYANNVKPGTASYTVTPKEQYNVNITQKRGSITGRAVTKTFPIKVLGPTGTKSVAANSSQIRIQWDKREDVSGYYLYRYNAKKKAYYLIANIKGNNNTQYVDRNLPVIAKQYYKVKSYVAIGNKTYASKAVGPYALYTKPYGCLNVVARKGSKPGQIDVSWNKRGQYSGYQVRYSTRSDFQKYYYMNIPDANRDSAVIKGRTSGYKYYVQVRSYKIINGVKHYSNWIQTSTAIVR